MEIEQANIYDYQQICACDHVAVTSVERCEELARAIAVRACYVARKDDKDFILFFHYLIFYT